MSAPSVEERLRRARGFAALLARTARQAEATTFNDVPAPAFWMGVSDLADQIEEDCAAIASALDVVAKDRQAPSVFVGK